MMLEQKLAVLDQRISRRDKREITLAICSVVILAIFMSWIPGFQAKIGAGLIIWGCLFTIYKLRMARKPKGNPAIDLRQYLDAAKLNIEGQINLMRTIVFWYLLPAYCGVVVFFTGLPISLTVKMLLVSGAAGLYLLIYQANTKVLKNELFPMKESVEAALDHFEG